MAVKLNNLPDELQIRCSFCNTVHLIQLGANGSVRSWEAEINKVKLAYFMVPEPQERERCRSLIQRSHFSVNTV